VCRACALVVAQVSEVRQHSALWDRVLHISDIKLVQRAQR
jgi:hypothetical protein